MGFVLAISGVSTVSGLCEGLGVFDAVDISRSFGVTSDRTTRFSVGRDLIPSPEGTSLSTVVAGDFFVPSLVSGSVASEEAARRWDRARIRARDRSRNRNRDRVGMDDDVVGEVGVGDAVSIVATRSVTDVVFSASLL